MAFILHLLPVEGLSNYNFIETKNKLMGAESNIDLHLHIIYKLANTGILYTIVLVANYNNFTRGGY